jgi:hypothetical protein
MVAAAYIAKAPQVTIENGVAQIEACSNGEILCWHIPLREFRMALARANRTLLEHDEAGEVVALRGHG